MNVKVVRLCAPALVAALALLPLSGATPPASAKLSGLQQCPTVTVSCPDSAEEPAEPTYTANVSGGDPGVTPTYN